MIRTKSIENNLVFLERRYQRSRSQRDSLLSSKQALLELCGWIEESMDDVVLRCSMRCLKDPDNQKLCRNKFVRSNYGFDYSENFRMMLIKLLGLVNIERLEAGVDAGAHAKMLNALNTLRGARNAHAHTHLRNNLIAVDAPSVTMNHFKHVRDGLLAIEKAVREKKW